MGGPGTERRQGPRREASVPRGRGGDAETGGGERDRAQILFQAPHPCPEDGHAVFVASLRDRGPPLRPGDDRLAASKTATACGLAECKGLVILTDQKTSEGPNLDGSDRRFREDSVGTGRSHAVPDTAPNALLVAASRAAPRPI